MQNITVAPAPSIDQPQSGSADDDHPSTVDELRIFVHHHLCAKENLLEDQFSMVESAILRGEQRCGIQFLLKGPRAVRLSAVWNCDRNEVFLYDAAGERYQKIELSRRITG